MKINFTHFIKNQSIQSILILIFIATLIQLGSWGFTETSEARYAQISKEMLDSGDYIRPTKLGITHYHKPPLTYYITTVGYQIFGTNEFGARFFLSVALVIQLLLVYKTSQLLFNNIKTSILAVVLYFSTPLVLASARNLTTDTYLTTFILMAIYFWLRYQEKKTFFFFFYLSIALGFLTKGPLVLLPIIIFQLTWLYFNKKRIKFSIYDLWGLLVFFVFCCWWYLAVIKENPMVFNYFTGDQLYQRMASKDAFNRGKPFWYYLVFLPVSLLPWVVYVFASLKKIKLKEIKEKSLLVTFILIIALFSFFKTKLIFYVLPSISFLVLFVSNKLIELEEISWKKFTRFLYIYFSIITIAAVIAILLHKIEVSFVYVLLLASGVLISLFGLKKIDWFHKNIYTLLINSIAILLFSTGVMNSNELLLNSPKPIANFVNTLQAKNVYVYNYLLPSMAFYTDKKIITVNNGNPNSQREIQFERNLNYLETYYNLEKPEEANRFDTDFSTQNSVFLVRKKETIPDNIKSELLPFKRQKDFGKWILYYN